MSYVKDKYCIKWTERSNISFVESPVDHLIVALFPSEVLRSRESHDNSEYICSTSNYIMELVSKSLKCSINFRLSQQDFGGFTVNGTWSGIIALLANESADVILQFFTYHEDRDSVLDFGEFFPTERLITILSVPTFRPENVLKIFFIFGPRIWILILLSFIAYSTFNALILKHGINRLSISIDYFGILTGQASFYLNVDHLSILISFWLITTFILRLLFASDIQALLLAKREIRIDSFGQLIERDDIILMVEAESSVHRIVLKEYPELVHRLNKINHRDQYRLRTLHNVISKSYALISNEYTAEQIIGHYNRYPWHQSDERKYVSVGNFPMRKGLVDETKSKLLNVFRNLHHSGIYSKQARDDILLYKHLDSLELNISNHIEEYDRSENKFKVVVKFRDLLVCFVLLSIGLSFALIVLIIELTFKRLFAQP